MNLNFFNLSNWKKCDVLDDLLSGTQREGLVSKKEIQALNRLVYRAPYGNAPAAVIKEPPAVTKKVIARPKRLKPKKKTTVYLSQEILTYLDRIQKKIYSLVPDDSRSTISRSHIVNQSLAIVLQEFRAKGKNSGLMPIIATECLKTLS